MNLILPRDDVAYPKRNKKALKNEFPILAFEKVGKFGAAERIRTFDRLVNSQPLYRAEPRRQSIMLMPLWSFTKVFKFSLSNAGYSICLTLYFAIAEKPL